MLKKVSGSLKPLEITYRLIGGGAVNVVEPLTEFLSYEIQWKKTRACGLAGTKSRSKRR